MKIKKHNHNNHDNTIRQVSTAVRKFCNLHPKLQGWRSKHKFVAWIRRRSRTGNMKPLKEVLNFCTRTVLETRSLNRRPGRVPRYLVPLLRLGQKGGILRVAVLSILNVIRLLTLSPVVDVRTLSAPRTGGALDDPQILSAFLRAARVFFPSFGQKPKDAYARPFEWSPSFSAGPNGSPAWDHAYEDLAACFGTELGDYLGLFVLQLPMTFREQWNAEISKMLDFILQNRNIGNLCVNNTHKGVPYDRTTEYEMRWWRGKLRDVVASVEFLKRKRQSSIISVESRIIRQFHDDVAWIWGDGFTFRKAFSACESWQAARAPDVYNHSKLAFLADKAGKTRVIAMGDVSTQSTVLPLEREIFRMLKKLPTDGTFNQDSQRERVRVATQSKTRCYSVDMVACTDRLPAVFQMAVLHLSGLLTKEQALAWYLLMTKREFCYYKPTHVSSNRGHVTRLLKHTVTYSVGQPMGFHSSWAVMTLSHHVLVRWAFEIAYGANLSSRAVSSGNATCGDVEPFQSYAILGDDIVIWDEPVAEAYLNLLALLGVEVSESKSFREAQLAEFAKAYYRSGEDLKPLSAARVLRRRDFGDAMLVDTARELHRKGFEPWSWLVETYQLSHSQVSTILAMYGVRELLDYDFQIASELMRRQAQFMDLLEQTAPYKETPLSEEIAYVALERHFNFNSLELARCGRLARAPLLWGEMPCCGPAWKLWSDVNLRTPRLLRLFHYSFVKEFNDAIFVGDDYYMWDPEFWGQYNPITLIGNLSLDQAIVKRNKFRPYARVPKHLSQVWTSPSDSWAMPGMSPNVLRWLDELDARS